MQYVKFGNTGMDVSRICLGMMSFGKPGKEHGQFPWARDFEDAKPFFKKAVELGEKTFRIGEVVEGQGVVRYRNQGGLYAYA